MLSEDLLADIEGRPGGTWVSLAIGAFELSRRKPWKSILIWVSYRINLRVKIVVLHMALVMNTVVLVVPLQTDPWFSFT